ncbi:MAG TPA: hypothetical protein PKD90_06730, partial [Phnomibacter sp.]|nr:hypothetical protein [Phnomibacter sp.]
MKLSIHLLMPLILTGAMAAGQNVGIGTTSPQTRLHVFNGAGPSIMRSESSTLSGEAALELKTANGVFDFLELRKWMPGASGTLAGIALDGLSQITTGSHATGGLLIGNKTARPLYFITDNTERLRITETGRVGIGVSNPTSMLEVDAGPGTETSPASETTIRFKSATEHSIRHWYMMGNNLNTALVIARFGTGIVGTLLGQTMTNLSAIYTNDLGLNALAIGTKNTIPLILGTNNQERLRITGTGKTGINTTNPLYALHVEDPLNTAIYARTRSNSNDTSAIRGVLDNTNGAAARAAGVRGVSNSTNQWSIGVYGTHSGGGWGVAGSVKEAGASGWGAGVYGEAGQGGGPSGTGGFGVDGLNFNTGGTAGFF